MRKIVIGILAHVDAGKTTLTETILYNSGSIRKLGRVDTKDTFLDTHSLEKERKITIFSKPCIFSHNSTHFTMIDTPGHIDFSQETERALSVLDAAILVVSASGELQSHTEALFEVLRKNSVPTFIFINKTDLDTAEPDKMLEKIKSAFDGNFVPLNDENKEQIAECSEELLDEYLNGEPFSDKAIKNTINSRKLFPVFFGSALKNEGIEPLLNALSAYTEEKESEDGFGAKVFKISSDEQSKKLTFVKITGGKIRVKDLFEEEKISEIRIYSGEKYQTVPEAGKGDICALLGLKNSFCGQGVGKEENSTSLSFQPLFMYKVNILDKTTYQKALENLKKLEEEDPTLKVVPNQNLGEINVQLMGEVQSEVLIKLIKDRFDMSVSFENCGISYKETIASPVYGVGHFEPLRHYAEVHLLLEPLKRGSGLKFFSDVSEDELDKNWQRLIMTHLEEKEHKGVLTGFPITDIKITLKAGKAHEKHTEGGDFRQATYRAVRQALMQAENVILEPWISFKIQLPTINAGKVMTDIENMGGTLSSPIADGDLTTIKGSAPLSEFNSYDRELLSITHGAARLSVSKGGYLPVKDNNEIIEKIGYDALSDTENPASSVFCAKGAGFTVPWDEVFSYMHLEKKEKKEEIFIAEEVEEKAIKSSKRIDLSFDELMKIYENTYGKIKQKEVPKEHTPFKASGQIKTTLHKKPKKEFKKRYLLIDGYNLLFAWFDIASKDSDAINLAKNALVERIVNYSAVTDEEIILVFDAYKVKGGLGSIEKIKNLSIVYTKEAQTADSYIEKTAKELTKNYSVRVATSDRLEQIIIFSGGAIRISEKEFLAELIQKEVEIKEIIQSENTPVYIEHEIKGER